MASKVRADSLSTEFECGVCFDQLKQPKFIGPCTHTFCKDCIEKYWVSLNRRGTIPCPQCRQHCPIPQSGADALKDNFTLSSIMETYKTKQKSSTKPTEVNCIMMCSNRATCVCKECDFKLCASCIGNHNHDNPKKRDHDVFGLCSSHGNGLFFFCHPCKKAVCSGCRISDHNQGNHAVTPIGPVVDALVSSIQDSFTELKDIEEEEGQEARNMLQLRDVIKQKTNAVEVQAAAATVRAIADKKENIRDRKAASQTIQAEIDKLVKKKAMIDDVTKQLTKDVDKLEKEKTNIIADVRASVARSSQDIDQYIRSINAHTEEVKAKLQRGHAVGFAKICIDTESIASLTSRNEELLELVTAFKERGNKTVMERMKKYVGEFGNDPDVGKMLAVLHDDHKKFTKRGEKSHGQAVVIGDPQAIRRETQPRVYTQLRKVGMISLTGDRPCRIVDRMTHLPDGRLVSFGRSTRPASGPAEILFLHDTISDTLCIKIEQGVHPANDMAALSTGELVVARADKPPIRVFNIDTGASRDVNITHENKEVGPVSSVATDTAGNMFILTSYPRHLLVVNHAGIVLKHVKLDNAALKMSFCPVNGILYIAARDTIRKFHWKDGVLSELAVSRHGIEGLVCYDVCVGSGGEVLAAGDMNGNAVIFYQVSEGDRRDAFVWRKITFQEEVTRKSVPLICVRGDHFYLGYDDKIEKFQLLGGNGHDNDSCMIM